MKRCLTLGASVVLALGCSKSAEPLDADLIRGVPQTEAWVFPKLHRAVHVVRTEANVPHIYASDRLDLAYVYGFVVARDRYFMMDLERRLGQGIISELLGDSALANDMQARGTGRAYVTERILEALTPELAAYFDAFAEGVNEYIAQVAAGALEAPSELELGKGLLGASSVDKLMKPFSRRDIAAIVAVVLYESSYETGDVGRAASAMALGGLFKGEALGDLRNKGALEDLWKWIKPVHAISSSQAAAAMPKSGTGFAPPLPVDPAMLERLALRLENIEKQFGRDPEAGFGSNAWAVNAAGTGDGSALLAGDGHLSLAVPSILYQIGLDTDAFGRGDVHQLGLTIPGFPVMPIGTNGKVAWSQTQLSEDITDWYREEIQLDANGKPRASRFKGAWKDLVSFDEKYVIADVPAFGSKGRTEVWARYQTFDGRWLADVEGKTAKPGDPLGAGESLVSMQGAFIIPKDVDGDGKITAVSFDYAGLDAGIFISSTDKLGRASDVRSFREGMRGLIGYSQNFIVADANGQILYSSYQAVPCRGYLKRNADGTWAPGADPNLLLDGTEYPSFEIPVKGTVVDESQGADPRKCVVPFDAVPQIIDPPSSYVATANNDPGGMSFDGSLTNDAHYLGGPWDTGFRANRITSELDKAIKSGAATPLRMAEIQGNKVSSLGEYIAADLLATIEYAKKLGSAPTSPADQRVRKLYDADAAAMDEVHARLSAWAKAGWQASSGVETFYEQPDDEAKKNSVATMIFNAWIARVVQKVFDDEKLPGVFPEGSQSKVLAIKRFLQGRGAGNPGKLASYNADTGESAFFDVLGTSDVENSHEVILSALKDALDFLRGPPDAMEKGKGGFGSGDMSKWLWGLRHQVRFNSLLGDYLPQGSMFGPLVDKFAINTKVLPLAEPIASNDPRAGIKWFPRGGDNWGVDAANPGLSGTDFRYGAGPVMRMVVRLRGNEVSGQNVIPGGQSAFPGTPYFADQAALWLGNKTLPMRFHPRDVVAGALGREVYSPR
jgi:penicillin amidase